jgi:hypothetical protein
MSPLAPSEKEMSSKSEMESDEMQSAKALIREEHACIMHLLACLLLALHWYQFGQAEPCDGHTPLIMTTYKTIHHLHSVHPQTIHHPSKPTPADHNRLNIRQTNNNKPAQQTQTKLQ